MLRQVCTRPVWCWMGLALLAMSSIPSCLGFHSTLPTPLLGININYGHPMSTGFSADRPSSTNKLKQRWKPLLITKTFFERLESRSGKDYSWIRPLTQPVSELMKYVCSLLQRLQNRLGRTNLLFPMFFSGKMSFVEVKCTRQIGLTVSRI